MRTRGGIINSQKHENTWSNLGQNASAGIIINIASATQRGDIDTTNPNEVSIGSRIPSIYFEFHFSPAQTANVNVVHWKVEVNANIAPTLPNTYNQNDKSFIIKRGMEMLPVNVATVFKRIFVVRIPKKYQRMIQGSAIQFRYIASSSQTLNTCGITIFKEYT